MPCGRAFGSNTGNLRQYRFLEELRFLEPKLMIEILEGSPFLAIRQGGVVHFYIFRALFLSALKSFLR
jgi:hypothetical protein